MTDALTEKQTASIKEAIPAQRFGTPEDVAAATVYLASLEATAAADRGELILPGHGDPFTGAAELVRKRAGMSDRRANKILRALDGERTAAEVGRELWRHVPVTQAYLVLSEVLGHLDLLEARGRVIQRAGDDGIVRWART